MNGNTLRALGVGGSFVALFGAYMSGLRWIAFGSLLFALFLGVEWLYQTDDPRTNAKVAGKLSLKSVWYLAALAIGFRLSNPVMHELGHLFVGSFFGYEVTQVNLWSYGGDHASVWFQGIDQSSWEWFATSAAGATTNVLLAVYATRRWNRTEELLSWRWPTLGFAAMGFVLAGFMNALYLLPVRVVSGSDYENLVRFLELNGYPVVVGVTLTGGVLLALVIYHLIYFIRINTTPIEVKLIGLE